MLNTTGNIIYFQMSISSGLVFLLYFLGRLITAEKKTLVHLCAVIWSDGCYIFEKPDFCMGGSTTRPSRPCCSKEQLLPLEIILFPGHLWKHWWVPGEVVEPGGKLSDKGFSEGQLSMSAVVPCTADSPVK